MAEQNDVATFTEQQLKDWQRYERVRQSGQFNMFGSDARAATRLGREEYLFVMENYSELKAASETP